MKVVGERELIETLWNVNGVARAASVRTTQELIETLWNVNMNDGAFPVAMANGINRDIVECKSGKMGRISVRRRMN